MIKRFLLSFFLCLGFIGLKDLNASLMEVRTAVTAKDFAALAKSSAALEALLKSNKTFWTQKKMADAVAQAEAASKAAAVKAAPVATGPKLFEAKVSKKPMTVDEAVLVSQRKKVNYVAFRDADTDGISIVIQRPDGSFDVVRA